MLTIWSFALSWRSNSCVHRAWNLYSDIQLDKTTLTYTSVMVSVVWNKLCTLA